MSGFDVSTWQDPAHFNFDAAKAAGVTFMIARASYGARTPDKRFVHWARAIREAGLAFGAYHFYRQIHSAEEQLALFDAQLEAVGGLKPGDLFPTLDMEENQANGDGRPHVKLWNRACDEIGDAWKERFGGCILYYSSYFPDYLNAHQGDTGWHWMKEEGYFHWLADYGKAGGQPRHPYTPNWHLHQPKPKPSPYYANGDADIDHDVLAPGVMLSSLVLPTPIAVQPPSEIDISARPGGALPADLADGLNTAAQGAELLRQGLEAAATSLGRA